MKDSENNNSEFEATEDQWVVKHTTEFFVHRTSARINNFAEIYFGIAQDSFGDYLIHKKSSDLNNNSPENYDRRRISETRLDQSSLKTIVFAAMTCEAAIYDIAAIHLSDEYARDVLDRLDPVSKWRLAPRLICGKSLRDDGPAMNSLRTLFVARNELVHAKSRSGQGLGDPDRFEKIAAAAERQAQKIRSAVVPAYQSVVLLSLELGRLFGTPSASIPRFSVLSHSRAYEEASEEVKEVILRCKQMDADFIKISNIRP